MLPWPWEPGPFPRWTRSWVPAIAGVQTAKLLAVLEGVAIDMVAGPTEVLVVADDSASPELIASDLISQAEHGGDSRAILVSTSREILEQVSQKVESQVQDLPRRDFAEEALAGSFSIKVPSMEEAFEFVNRYASRALDLASGGP